MLVHLLLLISLSSLVPAIEEAGPFTETSEEKKTELRSYVSTIEILTGDAMRWLIKLNNSVPIMVKECEKTGEIEVGGTVSRIEPSVKLRKKTQAVYKFLEELAFAVNKLHEKSVELMDVAVHIPLVSWADQVRTLTNEINICKDEKQSETDKRVACDRNSLNLESEVNQLNGKIEKYEKERFQNDSKECREENMRGKTGLDKVTNDLITLRENCSKNISTCENERDECVSKSEEDKKKHANELIKCNDENEGLKDNIKKCIARDESCRKIQGERDECQNELANTSKECEENKEKYKLQTITLKKCENNITECNKNCQNVKGQLIENLLKCNKSSSDLQGKLNETMLEKNLLSAEIKELNSSLESCNSKNYSDPTETDEVTESTIAPLPAANLVQGCESDLQYKLNETNSKINRLNSENGKLNWTCNFRSNYDAISMTTEPESELISSLSTQSTTSQPPTTQILTANQLQGCEAFEKASSSKTKTELGEIIFNLGNRQYLMNSNSKVSWTKARDICRSKGMSMLQLETYSEFIQVIPKLRQFSPATITITRFPYYWMGGKKTEVSHIYRPEFEWMCGGTRVQLVNFWGVDRSFFQFSYVGPCLNIYVPPKAIAGRWYALQCDELHNYACEKRLQ